MSTITNAQTWEHQLLYTKHSLQVSVVYLQSWVYHWPVVPECSQYCVQFPHTALSHAVPSLFTEVLESTRISQVTPNPALSRVTPHLASQGSEDDVDLLAAARLKLTEKESPWKQVPPQPAFYQAYKGQLQLSIYMNSGLLTVHGR